MLKVLLVSPDWPYPEYKNGVAKIVANLLAPNSHFEPNLLYIGDQQVIDNLNFDIRRIPSPSQCSNVKKIFRFAFSRLPFCTWAINDSMPSLLATLREIHHNYDVIHLIGPGFALLADHYKEEFFKKIVFSPVDSIGLHFERRKELRPFGVKRALYSIEATKCRLFETQNYPKFQQVSFVSDVDSKWVMAKVKRGDFSFIPNGVDTDYFSPDETLKKQERPALIFTGNMDYAPNTDAALFLIDHIFPAIEQKCDLDLYIVGSNPPPELKKRARKNIHITGFVPDIRAYLKNATIYVSPLREGSGIKNKVLEAMAMGKVVVGTELSFEGISCSNGVHCVFSRSSADEFANKIISILCAEENLVDIDENARQLIVNEYSWEKARERYCNFYASIL